MTDAEMIGRMHQQAHQIAAVVQEFRAAGVTAPLGHLSPVGSRYLTSGGWFSVPSDPGPAVHFELLLRTGDIRLYTLAEYGSFNFQASTARGAVELARENSTVAEWLGIKPATKPSVVETGGELYETARP